jgi:hypothetical protein
MKGQIDRDSENTGLYRDPHPGEALTNVFGNILLEMANKKILSEISGINNFLNNVYVLRVIRTDSFHELNAAKSLS